MLSRLGCCLVGVLVCVIPPAVQATPANKKALETYLGPFLKRPIECRTCHLPDAHGTKPSLDEVDKPHNVFGARLKAVRKELAKAGKPNDLESRLQAIAQEDSDGDGITNLLELLTGHQPGDKNDQSLANELKDSSKLLVEFARFQSRYRWKPFEMVTRPSVPAVSPGELVRQPLDAFIIAERQSQGLAARPEASKEVLVRRLYLDLTGLPPTMEERAAFLTDSRPDAYELLVDKLLASPRYAERWGRHWMDVWRYSDWAGYGMEIRESQPHIWRWRDWIIESLQADKPYDQMVREMLAGDELAPNDDKTIRATGFLVRNWYKFNRNVWLDNTVEHTAKAFLGLTVNCARCHDHMYDPIKQTEYYSFRAVFEPLQIRTDRLPGQPDTGKDGLARVYDAELDAKTYLFLRGNDKMPDKERLCPPAVPVSVQGGPLPVKPVVLPRDAYDVEHREYVLKEAADQAKVRLQQATTALGQVRVKQVTGWISIVRPGVVIPSPVLSQFELEVQAAQAELVAGQLAVAVAEMELQHRLTVAANSSAAEARTAFPTLIASAKRQQALAEAKRTVVQTQLAQLRSSAKNRAKVTEQLKQAQAQLLAAEVALLKTIEAVNATPKYPDKSTGRRLALAQWITSPRNPLAARVAVNHVWLRHFGQPLVNSVFDFGSNGQAPTHPALLDWLASEFMTQGWSLKKLHKTIVTSTTYRLDSTPESSSLAKDPDNRFYWRRLPQRMQAEAVRDSILHQAGKLDFTQGGPEIDYQAGLTTYRRSLYYRTANEKQMTFLVAFDAPSPNECYRRVNSVAPQQALAMANSSMAQEASIVIATQLQTVSGDYAFVQAIFERLLGRLPTTEEHKLCSTFLLEQTQRMKSSDLSATTKKARASLVLVLLNHHEFVTIR
ncbi:MAG: DUF1553 domain-containing protein [Gemmatales bacterium]